MKRIALLGQPYDSAVRNLGMGAGVNVLLKERKLPERLEREGYDVALRFVVGSEEQGYEIRRTLALDRQLAALVREAVDEHRFPIVLAGNCNSALGTTAGLARDNITVAWFDAHADLDTPENNLSGFFDVFALSMLTGQAWQALTQTIEGFRPIPETRIVLTGVRDLEPYQAEHLRRSQIHVVYGDEIRSRGLAEAFEPALEAALAAAEGCSPRPSRPTTLPATASAKWLLRQRMSSSRSQAVSLPTDVLTGNNHLSLAATLREALGDVTSVVNSARVAAHTNQPISMWLPSSQRG